MALNSLVFDSNFFIIGFKDNPESLADFKSICDRHGYQMYMTLKVFQEMDWRIRRGLLNKLKVLDISKREIDEFISKNQNNINFLPQRPDLSLVMLLNKLDDAILVSSDLNLVQTVNLLKNDGSSAMMGSAFLLKMIEEESDGKNKYMLMKLREKVYNEEIRYSILRQNFYDPVTRIKLIEQQSLDVIRNRGIVKIAEDYNWSTPDVNSLLILIKNLKDEYSSFLEDIREEKYEALINTFNNIRREIYNTLLLLNWQMDRGESEMLIRIVAPDLVLLNYFTAICYIYLGTRDGVYNAFKRLESASGIMLLSSIPVKLYRTLMVSLHQLRIIVLILLKKYDDAIFYFSLFERKCEEWGYTRQYEFSKGIYYALINLNGGQLVDKISDTANIGPALRFLLDLANQLFILKQVDESRSVLNQAFILNLELKDEKVFQEILYLALLLYYSSENTNTILDLTRYIEETKKILVSAAKPTDFIDTIWDEIKRRKVSLLPEVLNKNISSSLLPKPFLDWMTIFKVIDIDKKDRKINVICRNWKLAINVSIDLDEDALRRQINQGDLVRIGEGSFKFQKSKKQISNRFNTALEIIPDKNNSKLYIRGSQGFKCIDLCSDPLMGLSVESGHKSIAGKIKGKLHLAKRPA